jgi:hypothetical protein
MIPKVVRLISNPHFKGGMWSGRWATVIYPQISSTDVNGFICKTSLIDLLWAMTRQFSPPPVCHSAMMRHHMLLRERSGGVRRLSVIGSHRDSGEVGPWT